MERQEDQWAAYCVDRAVTTFGMALEGALNECEGKTTKDIEFQRSRVLNRWIPNATSGPQFADPAKQKVT